MGGYGLFEMRFLNYLISIDFFSKFHKICSVNQTSSAQIAQNNLVLDSLNLQNNVLQQNYLQNLISKNNSIIANPINGNSNAMVLAAMQNHRAGVRMFKFILTRQILTNFPHARNLTSGTNNIGLREKNRKSYICYHLCSLHGLLQANSQQPCRISFLVISKRNYGLRSKIKKKI